MLSLIGGALGIGVGAAILQVAPSLIPEGLLPATVTLAFDAARRRVLRPGGARSSACCSASPRRGRRRRSRPPQAMGSDSRTATGGGGRLRSLLVAGEVATAVLLLFGAGLLLRTLVAVESFDRGYRAESVLSMLVDPLGRAIRRRRSCSSSSTRSRRRSGRCPASQDVAWTSALAARRRRVYGDFALTYEIVGDPPVETIARADDELPGRQPVVFLDARPADRRRPRVRRARHPRQPSGLHRQRSVRAQPRRRDRRSACASRSRSRTRRRTSRTSARSSASRSR